MYPILLITSINPSIRPSIHPYTTAAAHRQQVTTAMQSLQAARRRLAPLAALAGELQHFDRQQWRAGPIAEVAMVTMLDFDSANVELWQQPPCGRGNTPSQLRRRFIEEAADGDGSRSLAPRLQSLMEGVPAVVAQGLLQATMRNMRTAATAHSVATLKAWRNAWPTTQRRGLPTAICVGCGPRRRDRLAHILVCRRLWRPLCRRLGVDAPMNLRDALALTPSEPDRGGRKKPRPLVRLLALSLVFDAYCKAAMADRGDGRVTHRERRRSLCAARAFAFRRLRTAPASPRTRSPRQAAFVNLHA